MKKIITITILTIGIITSAIGKQKREFDLKMCQMTYERIVDCMNASDYIETGKIAYEAAKGDLILGTEFSKICFNYFLLLFTEKTNPVHEEMIKGHMNILREYLADYCGYDKNKVEQIVKTVENRIREIQDYFEKEKKKEKK